MPKANAKTRLFKRLTDSAIGLETLSAAVALALKAAKEGSDFDAGVELKEISKLLETAKAQQ